MVALSYMKTKGVDHPIIQRDKMRLANLRGSMLFCPFVSNLRGPFVLQLNYKIAW